MGVLTPNTAHWAEGERVERSWKLGGESGQGRCRWDDVGDEPCGRESGRKVRRREERLGLLWVASRDVLAWL